LFTSCVCAPPAPQIVRWQADIERLQSQLQELAGEAYMVDESALAGVKAEDCIFKVGGGVGAACAGTVMLARLWQRRLSTCRNTMRVLLSSPVM
jgi:hypothetical protein